MEFQSKRNDLVNCSPANECVTGGIEPYPAATTIQMGLETRAAKRSRQDRPPEIAFRAEEVSSSRAISMKPLPTMLFQSLLELYERHREAPSHLLLEVKMAAAILERGEAEADPGREFTIQFSRDEFQQASQDKDFKRGTQCAAREQEPSNREESRSSAAAALVRGLRQLYAEQQKAAASPHELAVLKRTCSLLERPEEDLHNPEASDLSSEEGLRLPDRVELLNVGLFCYWNDQCEEQEQAAANAPRSGAWDRMERAERPAWETTRLRLRGLRPGDEPFLASLDADPEVMRYVHDGPRSYSAAFSSACLQVQVAPYGVLRGKWIVEALATEAAVGWIEIDRLRGEDRDYYALGYEFAPGAWGTRVCHRSRELRVGICIWRRGSRPSGRRSPPRK